MKSLFEIRVLSDTATSFVFLITALFVVLFSFPFMPSVVPVILSFLGIFFGLRGLRTEGKRAFVGLVPNIAFAFFLAFGVLSLFPPLS